MKTFIVQTNASRTSAADITEAVVAKTTVESYLRDFSDPEHLTVQVIEMDEGRLTIEGLAKDGQRTSVKVEGELS